MTAPDSGHDTAIEAAIEVALERRALLQALREALLSDEPENALKLARVIAGLPDEV